MRAALSIVLAFLSVCFSYGQGFDGFDQMEYLEQAKTLNNHRDRLRALIERGELVEGKEGDQYTGTIRATDISSAEARRWQEGFNRARQLFFQKLGNDKVSNYIRKTYWKDEVPEGRLIEGNTVFMIASSRTLGVELVHPLVEEFLKREGAAEGTIRPTPADNEGMEITFVRKESRQHEHVAVAFRSAAGALEMLRKGECDLAVLDREVTDAENKGFGELADLRLPAYLSKVGFDAYVVLSAKSGGGEEGFEELKIGIQGAGPKVLVPNDEIGVDFAEFLLGPGRIETGIETKGGIDGILEELRRQDVDPALIGVLQLSGWEMWRKEPGNDAGSVQPLAIQVSGKDGKTRGSLPDHVTLRTGEYPLTRSLNMASTSSRRPIAKRFRQFVVSEAGQKVVRKAGFVDQGELDEGDGAMERHEASFRQNAEYANLVEGARLQPFVIRFGSGSSEDVDIYSSSLNPDVRDNIERLVLQIAEGRLRGKEARVVLVGHTDSDTYDPGKGGNKGLGKKRCESVAKELRTMGIAVAEITGENSFADTLPVVPNDTPTGKALNRRVQIWLREESITH